MKKGFTIIEVVIAIGIFGIAVLGIMGYFALSTQFVSYARQTTIASNLAQEVVEETIAQPYDSLTVGNGTRIAFSTDSTNPYYAYQKQLNISYVNSDLSTSATDLGLKKIEVFVYWQATSGEKNVQMATLLSKK